MDGKQTSDQALDMAIKSRKSMSFPGSNLSKDLNHTIARNVVEMERGQYSDPQPVYDLDEATRDRLLVHARQDAAEALLHTRSIMDEVYRLKKAQANFGYALCLLVIVSVIWKYWPLII
jgi:HEAT repeat protein